MKIKVWSGRAWQEYLDWQLEDRKIVKRINELIKSIERDGAMKGIGKPEKMKYKKGSYNRRIDGANRLVYEVSNDTITIKSCKGHYDN